MENEEVETTRPRMLEHSSSSKSQGLNKGWKYEAEAGSLQISTVMHPVTEKDDYDNDDTCGTYFSRHEAVSLSCSPEP